MSECGLARDKSDRSSYTENKTCFFSFVNSFSMKCCKHYGQSLHVELHLSVLIDSSLPVLSSAYS